MAKVTLKAIITGYSPSMNGENDVTGKLLTPEGELLWTHTSTNAKFLEADLTETFPDRVAYLTELYPDGYNVVLIDQGNGVTDASA